VLFVFRIELADPGPSQFGEGFFEFRHMLRLAEKLEGHSKESIEQPRQSVVMREGD
jgi:hypothetical protein